jgi:protein-ribulosamine 3-kinase
MALPANTLNYLNSLLSQKLEASVIIHSVLPVSGGSINEAYCLQTNQGRFMLKANKADAYPDLFKLESKGLDTIGRTCTVAVPQVIGYGDFGNRTMLLMEWIDTRRATPKASALLGRQLANMHKNTCDKFGLEYDNYMGSLPQSNKTHTSWGEFFIAERLQPMLEISIHLKLLNTVDLQCFEKLYVRLNDLYPEESPALIHGDLWGGNYLIRTDGKPYLIDPAVSYGHREFDIAMTTLFGGFDQDFYTAYQEVFPLQPGWQQRINLWNLYPLLLHLNLFGTGYLGQVRECLQQYS